MSDAADHPGVQHHVPVRERGKRAIAIHRLLVSKNIVGPDEVRETIDRVRRRTPADGARVVVRAWTDPAFKARLMDDARSAVFELGYQLSRDA